MSSGPSLDENTSCTIFQDGNDDFGGGALNPALITRFDKLFFALHTSSRAETYRRCDHDLRSLVHIEPNNDIY